MRSILLALMAGLIVVGAVVATRTSLSRVATAPAASSAPTAVSSTAPVPADLGNSIRAYLMTNPEVLVAEKEEYTHRSALVRDAIKTLPDRERRIFIERQLTDEPVTLAHCLGHVGSFQSLERALRYGRYTGGGGLRDTVRIAGSSPEMWRDICVANRDELLAVLDDFEDELESVRSAP